MNMSATTLNMLIVIEITSHARHSQLGMPLNYSFVDYRMYYNIIRQYALFSFTVVKLSY